MRVLERVWFRRWRFTRPHGNCGKDVSEGYYERLVDWFGSCFDCYVGVVGSLRKRAYGSWRLFWRRNMVCKWCRWRLTWRPALAEWDFDGLEDSPAFFPFPLPPEAMWELAIRSVCETRLTNICLVQPFCLLDQVLMIDELNDNENLKAVDPNVSV